MLQLLLKRPLCCPSRQTAHEHYLPQTVAKSTGARCGKPTHQAQSVARFRCSTCYQALWKNKPFEPREDYVERPNITPEQERLLRSRFTDSALAAAVAMSVRQKETAVVRCTVGQRPVKNHNGSGKVKTLYGGQLVVSKEQLLYFLKMRAMLQVQKRHVRSLALCLRQLLYRKDLSDAETSGLRIQSVAG